MIGHWWVGLWNDVRDVVQACVACDQTKVAFSSVQPTLQPLPIKGLMYRWSIDLCGPFPKSKRGNTYIMIAVEHHSKWVETFPMKNKSAAETAYHFLNGVIARFGSCAEVVTDGGGEFQAEFDDILLRCLIDHRVTSAHHPQANGAAERMVKTIKTSEHGSVS